MKGFFSLFKPEGFEKHFLKIIANYDVKIKEGEELLKNAPNGIRKNMLKDRINKMKRHREIARKDLEFYRKNNPPK